MAGVALELDDLIVGPTSDLRSILARMTKNRKGVVFVCGPERHLVGVLTDGDVRRTLLEGTQLRAPASKIMNTDPIQASSVPEARELLHRFAAVAIPVVDDQGRVLRAVVLSAEEDLVLEAPKREATEDQGAQSPALAVVPARGGSRRLPRKNLAPLAGRPLIGWAIDAASAAETIGRVIVSTDDEEIAQVARSFGAEVPWMRPSALAGDDTPSIAVLEHAALWAAEALSPSPEIVVLLEPTAPVRPPGLVDRAVHALIDADADSVATVCELPHVLNPEEQLVIEDGDLRPYPRSASLDSRRLRGDQTRTYIFSGQVYATRTQVLTDTGSLFGDRCLPIEVPWADYLDIDTEEDLRRAALLVESRPDLHPPELVL